MKPDTEVLVQAGRPTTDEQLIERALRVAGQTRLLRIQHGARHQAAAVFQQLFHRRPAMIIADVNTFAVAGRDVLDSFRCAGHPCTAPLVFHEPDLLARYEHVATVERALAEQAAIGVAVGSGTINDITKLASHQLKQAYLVVATAASMDGYSSFGASITHHGSKQTYNCPAPAGILADLEVIESAPVGMSAAGYADLLAKIVAGADWLIADALAVEPLDRIAWDMLHGSLRRWVDQPERIRRGEPEALKSLFCGLAMSGFAMQRTRTSRPASGADHQFSHLWDMQRSPHPGHGPAHGFQVGIGTLASSALYEQLLSQSLEQVDVDRLASAWPDIASIEQDIRERLDLPCLVDKALEEIRAKWVPAAQLRRQLECLRAVWPKMRESLQAHLMPFSELHDRLAAAGSPCQPQQIGISPARLRASYLQAYYLRRRFTVLDLAVRTDTLAPALDQIFGPQGRWPNVTRSP